MCHTTGPQLHRSNFFSCTCLARITLPACQPVGQGSKELYCHRCATKLQGQGTGVAGVVSVGKGDVWQLSNQWRGLVWVVQVAIIKGYKWPLDIYIPLHNVITMVNGKLRFTGLFSGGGYVAV